MKWSDWEVGVVKGGARGGGYPGMQRGGNESSTQLGCWLMSMIRVTSTHALWWQQEHENVSS